MSRNDTVELSVEIIRETAKAILVRLPDHIDEASGNPRQEWFPLSTVNEIHHDEPTIMVVDKWIADQKGLV